MVMPFAGEMLRVPGLISEDVSVVPGLSRAAAFTLAGG